MEQIIANIVVFIILFIIIGGAIFYIVKSKKNGVKCIGCPHGGSCSSCCGGSDSSKSDIAKNTKK